MTPPDKSEGSWKEERLLLWDKLDRLEREAEDSKAKEKKQIDAAHTNIRALGEKWKWIGVISAFLTAVTLELLRFFLKTK